MHTSGFLGAASREVLLALVDLPLFFEGCHGQSGVGKLFPTVNFGPGTGFGLREIFDDEDAVDRGNAGLHAEILKHNGGAVPDDVMVVGVACDDDTDADDRVEFTTICEDRGGVGEFGRARDADECGAGRRWRSTCRSRMAD